MTLDLPTPPLPEEMSSGRVFDADLANGICAAFGVAVRLLGAGGRAGVAVQGLAQVLAVVVGHHGELEVDSTRRRRRRWPPRTPGRVISSLQRATGHGERDQHTDDAVVADVDGPQHAEVDDRAVQFGVLAPDAALR